MPHVATAAHHARGVPWGTPLFYNKEAEMARALTLSALYIMALGTMFGAYALTF
jgi:hypothetical protein